MKLTHKSIGTLFAGLVVLGLSGAAQAQDPPPPSEPPPPAPVRHSSSGGGGAGIGVGITQTLASTGAFGAAAGQFVYDTSMWHLEGLFGFNSQEAGPDDRQTTFVFGAGGWFHFNQGSSSDFSLGGLIAVDTTSAPGGSTTTTVFEPGALIRAFVTPNVAVFGRGGLAFRFGDTGNGTQIGLGGQVTGGFGATYFFR
jgi:hypothetical protein